MKPFLFQQFNIQQSPDVFRIGTDGVLLGALASVQSARNILEVGSGTGLISLMLAQRNPRAGIVSVDISPEASRLSGENFKSSPFHSRLSAICIDYKDFCTESRFDLVVCNPPYFEPNESVKDVVARQKRTLDFTFLISKSATLLSPEGVFSVIIPVQDAEKFVEECEHSGLLLFRKIEISGIEGGPVRRCILEFSKALFPFSRMAFAIEKSPRKYSDLYLELTREFHVFKK